MMQDGQAIIKRKSIVGIAIQISQTDAGMYDVILAYDRYFQKVCTGSLAQAQAYSDKLAKQLNISYFTVNI